MIVVSRYQSEAPDGQPTHTPKIRIRGADPGSPEYNALVDAHRTSLRQFHASQQQQASLSGQRVYRASKHVAGAKLTYHNNEGQETITMVVDSGGEEQKEEVTKDEFWQWAIIETTIPDMTLTSAEMSAFMNPKLKAPKIGAAWDANENFDTDRPTLAYPDIDIATEINALSGQADQVSSLRVDLRPYPGGVKFDLYGFIHSYIDPDGLGPINGSAFHAGRKANSISSGAWTGTWTSSSGLLSGAYPAPVDISGRTQGNVFYANTTPALVQADFPETAAFAFTSTSSGGLNTLFGAYGAFGASGPSYTGIDQTWSPGSGNDPTAGSIDVGGLISAAGGLFTETVTYYDVGNTILKAKRGIGAMDYYENASTSFLPVALNGAGPSDAQGNYGIAFFDYTRYSTSSHDALTVYPSRAAPIRFSVFDGETPDAYTRLTGFFGTRRRWEDSKRGVDKRWPFKQIAVANIQSIDNPVDTSIENHFGMIKLGTVIINPRKGKGGIKFIAA